MNVMSGVRILCALFALQAAAAAAQEVTGRTWLLNPDTSTLSLTTTKNVTKSETHFFTTLDGRVTPTGEAEIIVDLSSLDTGIDIRNVRMRFLFFETFRFPVATLTARVEPGEFAGMAVGETVALTLPVTLDLHGVQKQLTAQIVAIRISDTSVKVLSTEPVTVLAADFGLSEGIDKLEEAAGGVDIVPRALVAFELDFEDAEANSELAAARLDSEQRQLERSTRPLTAEECQNRMVTISATRQIFFASGSAAVEDAASAPVLNEVAQFFNRCPAVVMEIAGHTDAQGSDAYNQSLSERRAAAVLQALVARGVDAARLSANGYGEAQPVADNTTTEGRARNRRIEFKPLG